MTEETQDNIAKKLIDDAIQKHAEHLDFSKLNITYLPKEIGQLSNLTSLDLSYSRIATLPAEIGKLTRLTNLKLHCCWNLVTLPPEIKHLKNLETLDLESARIIALPSEIGQLKNLITVNLKQSHITMLPAEIGQLSKLETLNLYYCSSLNTLPVEIAQLFNLKSLNLENCHLNVVPIEIYQIYSLTTLNLQSNDLTSLSPEISRLSNLVHLDLSHNELSTLPPEIGTLHNLNSLNLAGNPLVVLPAEIGQLSNLINLNLFNCRLTSLPAEIGNLTKLVNFDLFHNPLNTLPIEIDSLPNLKLRLSSDKHDLPRKQKSKEESILITILEHYRPLVKFSLVTISGMYEILRLYVEVEKMFYCVPSPAMIEALFFGTNYKLTLIPSIRIYPLFPPSINARDAWILKEKDAELFGIEFEWPSMMAASVVIKADVYDYVGRQQKTISSAKIWLQRNGETIADNNARRHSPFAYQIPEKTDFIPDDNPIPLSPYLYKLITIDGFIKKVNVPEARQLNKEAYDEIAGLFHSKTGQFEKLLKEKQKHDIMFESNVHPTIAAQLVEIAPILRRYLDLGDVMTDSAPTTILFLASDPTNASRLRLGEEFREIQEKLNLANLRDHFRLELPQLSARPEDISQALLNIQPQIVHFSGHGDSTGAICFEQKTGEILSVKPEALAALFKEFSNHINCVILNACYSEIQAKVISEYINYVIGMNKAIGDGAAIAFTVGFYQALGAGRTIEDAYNLGCVQIMLQGFSEHVTPVLIKKQIE